MKQAHWAALVAISSAGMIAPGPAFGAQLIATRGGWDIVKDDDSCWLSMKFEGPGETELTLMKQADGDLISIITNYEWSAKKGARYKVDYALNGTSFGGAEAVGVEDGIRKGFASSFEPNFEQAFTAGSSLHVFLNDQRIDQLSLAGTAVAMTAVNRCLATVRAEIAAVEREKARWAHLPKDPFAGGGGQAPLQPAKPMGNPTYWSSTNDYPPAALRENRQGTTEFRLTIGVDGRARDCQITSSSGHADLDAATCSNIQRRARFNPATDKDGQPTESMYESRVRWVLPRNDIAAPLRAAAAAKAEALQSDGAEATEPR